jgi:hypothetical protein
MHRTALARAKWRTRSTNTRRSLRTRTLENRLTRDRSPRRRTHGSNGSSRLRCWGWWSRTRRRSLINRTRASLRNNHARRRCLRRGSNRVSRRTRRTRGHGSSRRCGSSNRWRCGRGRSYDSCRRRCGTRRWRNCCRCRRGCRRRNRDRGLLSRWRHDRGTRSGCGRLRSRNRGGRGKRSRGRSWFRWRSHDRWPRRSRRRGTRRWRSRSFLLLRDRLQHIAGTGNVRQINLGFYFFFAAQCARSARRRRLRFGRAADVGPYFFCFMLLQRTGMGLLLRHPDER